MAYDFKKEPTLQTTPQLELAYNYVQFTGRHVFLTGKAGTGKTTFLQHLREHALKRMVVTAPTGVAAINARGVTLHSFFQLPLGTLIDFEKQPPEKLRVGREKLNIMRSLNLLVIDEISMVRADVLDAVDFVLRRFRRSARPFGGVQLLMIGDLQQLPPVVKDDERQQLLGVYETPYFFSSKALRATSFVSIELTHIFRQRDERFIELLNRVRENRLDENTLQALNARYLPGFAPADDAGYIMLCTHNQQARRINEQKLAALDAREYRCQCSVTGTFPEYAYPTEAELILKVGAQVMFVKNDPSADKRYYNGRIGRVTRITGDTVFVRCPDDADEIEVAPADWDNVKFGMNEAGEIGEIVEGTFTQLPLRLAWAITIHKSQGLTFERAIIDAQASFAHGQVYVALSRCKTLEGIVLSTPLRPNSVINDRTVSGFTQTMRDMARQQTDEAQYRSAHQAYQHELLAEMLRFEPLQGALGSILRLCDEFPGSIAASAREAFYAMRAPLDADIVAVARRFQPEVQRRLAEQPDIEGNPALQERIGKAAVYFSDKIRTCLLEPLERVNLESDNKEVRRRLREAATRYESAARVACEGLLASRDGFACVKLLNARAAAAIENDKPVARTSKERKFTAADDATIAHPILFERLQEWRRQRAEALGRPQYFVFAQKTLYALVAGLPLDLEALRRIDGFGDKKVQDYGAEIVDIIRGYCEENSVAAAELPVNTGKLPLVTARSEKRKTQAPALPKGGSRNLTLRLFKEGKSIEAIAAERGMVVSTIVSHLVGFVETGVLAASAIVPQAKLERMVDYFKTAPNYSLSLAKEALGDVSYDELRLALAQWQWDAQNLAPASAPIPAPTPDAG